jgi:spermidine synthase
MVFLSKLAIPLHIFALVCLSGCQVRPGIPFKEKVLYEKDSLYNHIVVSEDLEARYLRFGYGYIQSAMTLSHPTSLRVPYTAYLMMGLSFTQAERALMVGLAGGAMVRFIREVRPDLILDVVEIDPSVVEVANQYFGIEEDGKLSIHVDDGRVFVKRASERYDWVILDAFHADTVPHHMTTVEYFRELGGILSPGGVVTINIAPLGPGILHMALIRTFTAAFAQVYIYQVPNRGNIVVVGSNEPNRVSGSEIVRRLQDLKDEVGPSLSFLEVDRPFLEKNPTVIGAPVLTDDYAPVDELRYRLAEGVRLE